MLTCPMICQSRSPAQWQLPLPPQHLPLPYNNGHRAAEVEVEGAEVGVTEAEEAVEEVAEEAAEEEEVHLVGNLLLHL